MTKCPLIPVWPFAAAGFLAALLCGPAQGAAEARPPMLVEGYVSGCPPEVVGTAVVDLPDGAGFDVHIEASGPVMDPTAHFTIAVPAGALPVGRVVEAVAAPVVGLQLLASEAGPVAAERVTPPVLKDLGHVRRHRLARVDLPRRPAGPEDCRVTSAILRFEFPPGGVMPGVSDGAGGDSGGPSRSAVGRLVLNPSHLDRFATAWPALPAELQVPDWTPVAYPWSVRMSVTTTGLHQVRVSALATSAPGLLTTPRRDLRLVLDGRVAPHWFVPAGAPGEPPAPEDRILFWARESDSPYSRANTHWLVAAPDLPPAPEPVLLSGSAPAGSALGAAPHRHVTEVDERLVTRNDQFLSILDYRWVWRKLAPGKVEEFHLDAPLYDGDDPDMTPLPVALRFFAAEWPAGSLRVPVSVTLADGTRHEVSIAAPSEDLHTVLFNRRDLRSHGTTTFSLAIEGGSGAPTAPEIYFDSASATYPKRLEAAARGLSFNVPAVEAAGDGSLREFVISNWPSDAQSPVAVAHADGHTTRLGTQADAQRGCLRVWAPQTSVPVAVEVRALDQLREPALSTRGAGGADLRAPAAADVVSIEHGPLSPAFDPLVEQLRAEGHQVLRARIDDVYDQFSAGQETPWAIRRMLAHQMRHGTGGAKGAAASTLLLVGDATSDFRGEFRNEVRNQVPSFPHTGSTLARDRFASDSWFTCASGEDELADAVVGRFSLNKPADVEAAVAKTLRDRTAPDGPWLNTVGFIADHSEFEDSANRLLAEVPPDRFRHRIQVSDEPWLDNFYFPKEIADAKKAKVSPATTTKIRDLFQQGPRLMTFLGHGSPNIWSTERVWFGGDSENSDNLFLRHPGRHPILVAMTCNNGAIDYPMPRWNVAISEDMLRQREGGPVALFVPSGPGTNSQHERLTREILRAIFHDRLPTLGAATALATLRYQAAGNPPDLPRMFILLGDPAVPLRMADAAQPVRVNPDFEPPSAFRQTLVSDGIEHWRESPVTTATVVADLSPSIPSARPTSHLPEWTALYQPAGVGKGDAPPRRALMMATPSASPFLWSLDTAQSPVTCVAGATVELAVLAQNPHPAPITLLTDTFAKLVMLDPDLGSRTLAYEGPPVGIAPGETRRIMLPVKVERPGIHQVAFGPGTPFLGRSGDQTPGRRVIVRCMPADAAPPAVAVALDDLIPTASPTPAGVDFHFSGVATNFSATTRSLTLVLASQTDNLPLENSMTALAELAPGELRPFTIRHERAADTTAPAHVRLLAVAPDARPTADIQVSAADLSVGDEVLPDLAIRPKSIRVSNTSPTDGETVFFDVDVENLGPAAVRDVFLEATDETASPAAAQVLSRINRISATPWVIDGNSSRTMRLRWDPFANSGERQIRITARARSQHVDRNAENNSATTSIRVRTKYRLRRGPVAVIPPDAEDIRKRQIRIGASIINDGETDAHAVRVTFYATPRRTPQERLGEMTIETVPANGEARAMLVYPLKPGDEKRQFAPAIEAVLRGSSQRLITPADP